MATIWCISAPLFSHADWGGFLRTARALAARGHDVRWVSGEALRRPIEGAGLAFSAIPETGWLWPPPPAPDTAGMSAEDGIMLRYRRALDTWLDEEKVAAGIRAIITLTEELGPPDLILSDPFLSAAAVAAEIMDVPLVVCGWPAMRELDETSLFWVQKTLADESRQRIERLFSAFSITGRNFSSGAAPSVLSPLMHVTYFTRNWYQADEANLLPQNIYVGGIPVAAPEPDWLQTIPAERPLALITLGTTFTGDLGFYAWAAQAAARENLLPVVALGGNPIAPDAKADLIKALPRGTRLVNYVPFDAILPRARLMIHHGGMGTTHAAVVWGIPQIVVPHAADQRGQARRAAQSKVGLNLTAHDVRQGKLWEGARALLNDARVLATCRALADEMAALGGPATTAEKIEALL